MANRSRCGVVPVFARTFIVVFFALMLVLLPCLPVSSALELDAWTYLRFHYEHNDQGDENFIRMYNDLAVTNIIKDRLDLHFSGWFNYSPPESEAFRAVNHNYARISNANLLLKFADPGIIATLGRQYLPRVDNFSLDGALIDYSPDRKLDLFAFGGRPVSFYSSNEGGYMFGGGIVYKPWWKTTLQVDGFVLNENDILYNAEALRLTQFLPLNTQSHTRLRLLQGDIRDFYTTLSSYFEKIGVSSYLNFYLQPNTLGEDDGASSRYFSHYGQLFGSAYPFYMVNLQLQKFLGDHWVLNGGISYKRLLRDSGDLAVTNVDSDVYNAGVTYLNFLIKGLDLTVLGNYVDNKNDRFFDITGELDYRITEKITAAVGLTYAGYRFANVDYVDTLNGEPSVYNLDDHIGSEIWFVDLSFRPFKNHKVSLLVSYENIDERYENAVVAQLGYRFHFDLGAAGLNADSAGRKNQSENRASK